MLGKKSRPVIGLLMGSIVSGEKPGIEDNTSPRIQPQSKIQSPKGLKSLDLGGVGLGIVAALERSGETATGRTLFGRNLSRSNPIPVTSPRIRPDLEETEEYTTFFPKVYCDGIEDGYRAPFRIQKSVNSKRASVFHISPARNGTVSAAPPPDFLSSCNMCQKHLHGKDIYMYRGEKSFCSTECRYKQMIVDERQEKCSWEAPRPAEISGSPLANGQICTTGILAT